MSDKKEVKKPKATKKTFTVKALETTFVPFGTNGNTRNNYILYKGKTREYDNVFLDTLKLRTELEIID